MLTVRKTAPDRLTSTRSNPQHGMARTRASLRRAARIRRFGSLVVAERSCTDNRPSVQPLDPPFVNWVPLFHGVHSREEVLRCHDTETCRGAISVTFTGASGTTTR